MNKSILQILNVKKTARDIWNIKQNKPSYIARDFEMFGIPREITHTILLARGVYKWLAVRRKLVRLKNEWKERIKATIQDIMATKKSGDSYKLGYLRGYLKAYEEARKEIRALCHSDRLQAPDFDKEAREFLEHIKE